MTNISDTLYRNTDYLMRHSSYLLTRDDQRDAIAAVINALAHDNLHALIPALGEYVRTRRRDINGRVIPEHLCGTARLGYKLMLEAEIELGQPAQRIAA